MKNNYEYLINKLFSTFKRKFGEEWTKKFHSKEVLELSKKVWLFGLMHIDIWTLNSAIKSKKITRAPSLTTFRNLCQKEMKA